MLSTGKCPQDPKMQAEKNRQDDILDMTSKLEDVQQKIIAFRNERDWAQFHDPKNLAEALSIEAGELLENFIRKTAEQFRNLTKKRTQVRRGRTG